jgi:hypothetical protein
MLSVGTESMKPRIRKILTVTSVVLVCYFGAYFASVRTVRFEHKDTIVPLADYRPVDGPLVRGLFWFAHLIDAALLRPARWEPGSAPHAGPSNQAWQPTPVERQFACLEPAVRHGARQIGVIERDMVAWMEEHEYTSVAQMKGSLSQKNCDNPSAFERAQYMKAISQFPMANS